MSIVKEKRKKKTKYSRQRSMKVLRRKRIKRSIYKSRGWKIKRFPELFKETPNYPYIIRIDDDV